MIRAAAVALIAAFLYAALGVAVAHAPPSGIDRWGRTLAHGPDALALFFTRSCLWYALVGLAVLLVAIAAAAPAWRGRVAYALVVTLAGWRISDVLKNLFHRPRPPYWRLLHETSFSYSSGHAFFATVVYGLWAWFVWRSSLPRPVRVALAPLLALWAPAVLWSRLALGAHYVTDLAGGVLLGIAVLAAGDLVRRVVISAAWKRSRRASITSGAHEPAFPK